MRNKEFQSHSSGVQERESRLGGIVLTSNPQLLEVVEQVQQRPPYWKFIIRDYFQTEEFKRRKFTIETIQGSLGEIYLNQVLKSIASFREDTVCNPISQGTTTQNYRFEKRRGRGNLVAVERETGIAQSEFDGITEIAGLPVVWEIKIRNTTNRTADLNHIFRDSAIRKKFASLVEHYGSNQFGYVVNVPPQSILSTSSVQREFREKGGIILFPSL